MPDPLRTARELRRVLKPGGLWINFSNPMILLEEAAKFGRPRSEEMAALFCPLGFDALCCERGRSTLLNFDHLSTQGYRSHQEIHHFVMRRKPDLVDELTAVRASVDDAWWNQVVHRVPYRTIEARRCRTLADAQGGSAWRLAWAEISSLPTNQRTFAVVRFTHSLRGHPEQML